MISKIESIVNSILTKYPNIKKTVKRAYQLGMYAVSPKIKSEGDIVRVSPDDEFEYFFGYYDKSPWNINERYILCLKVKETHKNVAPEEPADIILIDTQNNYKYEKINRTNAWNVQQGCMLQWLGPDFDEEIIFNDYRNGDYCSVIYNINTKEERIINKPVYDVSKDGNTALSLDFARLHTLRPGYGYSNKKDNTSNIKVPDETAIWKVNLKENTTAPLIKYTDLYNFEHRDEMEDASHGVNHIMINPTGNRFMFLHRWLKNNKKYSRLITLNIDGTNAFNLNDDDMTSHSYWKNDSTILSYARKEEVGIGYLLFKDNTNKYEHVLTELKMDGHPSYSPNNEMIITDSYPNRSRVQSLYLVKNDKIQTIGKVHAPFKYDNDFRCDLHPRWDRNNEKIAFDSVFEGKRRLYIIKLTEGETDES